VFQATLRDKGGFHLIRKILLLGRNGQVGKELATQLPCLGELVAVDRQQVDLAKPNDVRDIIRQVHPSIIVNAAAYTAVDQAEKDDQAAQTVNADAPALMAKEAKKIGALLVHYSTDYVFDGSKNSPYGEDDSPNPVSVYGKTKLAGEDAIREVGHPFLVFRTAWVYGTSGRNFLLTILRLATEREELRIVNDQIGAPTWSSEIAAGTTRVLQMFLERGLDSLSDQAGIYHMTASGETTWYQFANAILEEASRIAREVPWFRHATNGHALVTRRIFPISTAQYPTPAKRPAYSVLSNARLKRVFGFQLPSWPSQLSMAFGNHQGHAEPSEG
jgi:dTDP-4-dehydrorhamnose reductase